MNSSVTQDPYNVYAENEINSAVEFVKQPVKLKVNHLWIRKRKINQSCFNEEAISQDKNGSQV